MFVRMLRVRWVEGRADTLWWHTSLCEEKVTGGFPSPTTVWVFTPRGCGVTSDVSTRGETILNPLPQCYVLCVHTF